MEEIKRHKDYQLIRKYADVLFEVSDGVCLEEDILRLGQALRSYGDYKSLLRRAELFNDYYALLLEFIDALGVHTVLREFVKNIREHLNVLVDFLDFYPEYVFERGGGTIIHMVYATTPNAQTQEHMRAKMSEIFKDQEILCKFHSDKSILGGIKIYKNGNLLDYSLLSFINNMLCEGDMVCPLTHQK